VGRVDSNGGIETGGSTGIGDGIIGIGTDCNVVGVDADCMAVGVGADDGGTDGSRIGMDVETGIDVGGSGSSVMSPFIKDSFLSTHNLDRFFIY